MPHPRDHKPHVSVYSKNRPLLGSWFSKLGFLVYRLCSLLLWLHFCNYNKTPETVVYNRQNLSWIWSWRLTPVFAWLLLKTFLLRGNMERAQVCCACSSLSLLMKGIMGPASRPHLTLLFFQRSHLQVPSTYALRETGIWGELTQTTTMLFSLVPHFLVNGISMCLEHFPLTVLSVLLRDSLHRSTLLLAVTSEVRHGPDTYCPGFSHSCRAPLLPRPTTQCARKSQGRLLGTSDPDMTPRPRPGRHPQKAAR